MHKTLLRQLAKLGLDSEKMPETKEQWDKIISSVSLSYNQYDEDRYLLERSLEISSTEMRDEINRRQEMSLQLIQAGKMASLGTLASGVAHELNNPLAIILSYAEILLQSSNLNEKDKVAVEKIIKVSHRMAGIIKHLLKLSHQGTGEKNTLIEIGKPINESLDLLRSQFESDNIQIRLNYTDNDNFIYGNENALISIFQNLFTNSRDAFIAKKTKSADQHIEISIKKHLDNKNISIFYKDNAGGISNDVINKIFDPFFTTKDIGVGTGLGLSISKQIIEEHRGSINVRTVENVGTHFEIILPLANETTQSGAKFIDIEATQSGAKFIDIEATQSGVKSVPVDKSAGKKKSNLSAFQKKILVVDDEEDICDYFQELMSDSYAVTTTSVSPEALQLIDKEDFDLVITDLNMPLVTGQQLAAHLRMKHPRTKLIFISGHFGKNLTGSLNPFKPFIFLEKPFPESRVFKNIIIDYLKAR
ncbi:MAG: hybrid sensor histidine kinase/response regulator [Bdellovibrionota bacterium]